MAMIKMRLVVTMILKINEVGLRNEPIKIPKKFLLVLYKRVTHENQGTSPLCEGLLRMREIAHTPEGNHLIPEIQNILIAGKK